MDEKTFDYLCELSKITFSDGEKVSAIKQMGDITALMDTVCGITLEYDDAEDGAEIRFSELREDIPGESYCSETLLSNTEARSNCYVIPKMMD